MDLETAENLSESEMLIRLKMIRYKVFETQIESAWQKFEQEGFKIILVKGWAASQNYPQPFERDFSDIDLLVSPEDYQRALEFSKTLQIKFPVDLHKGARHYDRLDFRNLYTNSVVRKCGETQIRVLRPEDHLRLISIHWLNDGGARKDRLWDIYYAVANRPESFDWERALNIVDPNRRRWIICAIGMACKYLELNIDDTPIYQEAKNLPKWFVRAIEAEWKSETKLLPLQFFVNDKKTLWKQIKKRIPPNPVQATIEMNGSLDNRLQIVYQMTSIFPRILPSLKRFLPSLQLKTRT